MGLTVAVTGANGALGRAAVAALAARGHRAVPLVRSGPLPEGGHRLDLATDDPAPALAGCDAVVHAAASVTGGEAEVARDTVAATRRLVAALGGRRLVLASSVAVYRAGRAGEVVDEAAPLEDRPEARDAYTRGKLAQEDLAHDVSDAWLLRIGHLWGPGRTGAGHLGPRVGGVRLVAAAGPLPIAHLAHAGLACALACERPAGGAVAVNVLDADLPDARRWLRALPDGPWLPLSWRVFDGVAGLSLPGAPGLLRRPALRARMMPRRWPTQNLRDRLSWAPLGSFETLAREARP